MRAPALQILAVLAAGCSTAAEAPGCLDENPPQLGASCNADGECGNWLVCEPTCALPPAVSGIGGAVATLTDGTETTELRVEVARSDIARTRGLGSRPCIEDGWGLLIEFPTAGEHVITTESMRFALDIAMIGEDDIVQVVHRDAPARGKALYGADQPVKRVLEIPAGSADLREGALLSVSE